MHRINRSASDGDNENKKHDPTTSSAFKAIDANIFPEFPSRIWRCRCIVVSRSLNDSTKINLNILQHNFQVWMRFTTLLLCCASDSLLQRKKCVCMCIYFCVGVSICRNWLIYNIVQVTLILGTWGIWNYGANGSIYDARHFQVKALWMLLIWAEEWLHYVGEIIRFG